MKKLLAVLTILASTLWVSPSADAEGINIKKLVEKKVTTLPPGDLYWRIENFPSLAEAQATAGPWSVAAEARDKVWLFTLGPAGESGAGTKVAELGPVPRFSAPEYLLRVNEATGAPGAKTAVHSHPGSESFYVLAGEQSVRGPYGVMRIRPGQPAAGHGADMAMEVTSTGTTDMDALVMFILDPNRPFMAPAQFQ